MKNCSLVPKLYKNYNLDRKSTRLNSSHSQISYAVFCLKKKNVPLIEVSSPFRRQATRRIAPITGRLGTAGEDTLRPLVDTQHARRVSLINRATLVRAAS